MTSEESATSDLFDLYAFPLSRQLYALNRVEQALVDCDDALLCGWVADAIRLGEQAYELQVDFSRRTPNTEFGAQARLIDRELDRAVGAVAKFMAAIVQAFGDTSAQAELARFAMGRLLPNGVAAVIHLPYVEEEIAVRMLLRRAKCEPRLAQALHELGATPFLERVAALHARYQEALRNKQPRPSFAQVKQARQAGQERLCKIVALLLVRLATGGQRDDQAAALRKALHELNAQNAAIGRLHRRRRRVTEVDPETGEVLGEEQEGELDPEAGEALGEEQEAEVDPETGEALGEEQEAEVDPETGEALGEEEETVGEEFVGAGIVGEGSVGKRGETSSSVSSGGVARASGRVLETIEDLGERFAEPWRPGDQDGMDIRRGLAMRRHHEQPRAG